MRAISLFSGAGGFEIGFDRAGIQTVLQAESDPWCLSVLARHWPNVERVTDVHMVDKDRQYAKQSGGQVLRGVHAIAGSQLSCSSGRIDLIYGGFPCQDVSVAGKRAGLSGERSGLWHEFRRVLRELRPRWTVVENVPGLLSSHSGRDFATILLGLEELGYGWAYRVLDARFFGVPQRRRRVFVVGCLGDARRAAQVLAVCESCGGHPAPRRETGQAVAYSLAASVRGTGDGHGNAWNTTYLPASLSAGGHPGSNMPSRHKEDDVNLVTVTLAPGAHPGGVTGRDAENGALLVANGLRASDGHHGHSSPRGDGADNLIASPSAGYNGVSGDEQNGPQEAHAREVLRAVRDEVGAEAILEWAAGRSWGLRAQEVLRSELYGEGLRLSPWGESWLDGRAPSGQADRRSQDGMRGLHVGEISRRASSGRELPEQCARELDRALSQLSSEGPQHSQTLGVRRLTPLEAERLMGWPDEWTRWTDDGREIPDSHRYRMCGNGVVATVAEWIGHRLVRANQFAERAA